MGARILNFTSSLNEFSLINQLRKEQRSLKSVLINQLREDKRKGKFTAMTNNPCSFVTKFQWSWTWRALLFEMLQTQGVIQNYL